MELSKRKMVDISLGAEFMNLQLPWVEMFYVYLELMKMEIFYGLIVIGNLNIIISFLFKL